MTDTRARPEKDIIRSALRVLNLQAVVVMLVVLILPYVMSYQMLDDLVENVYFIAGKYGQTIHAQYLANPAPEQVRELAATSRSLIAYEGQDARWYTDGENIITLQPGMPRPYAYGIRQDFALDSNSRLIITWPTEFFQPSAHIKVVLGWIAMPLVFLVLLYFLTRSTLRPLRWMQGGIQELTRGNYNFTAPVAGRDRNNALAHKFNTMTSSIRELIKSKDQLIMDLSHELRSPITRIKVALALLPPDKNLGVVEKNIQDLEDIITTILEAQRINLQDISHKRERCRLADIVRECMELTRGQKPGIEFVPAAADLSVSGDKGLLKLLVHNLLDNALKYSPEEAGVVKVELCREENNAILAISDRGSGIPEEFLLKVFEPFYKVAPERGFNQGYGLGLSLCKRITDLHGGSITLANRQEGGLTVRVSLPAA